MIKDGREQNNAKRRRNAEKERRFFERRAIEAEFSNRSSTATVAPTKGLEPFELDKAREGEKRIPGKAETYLWKQAVRPETDPKKPWR